MYPRLENSTTRIAIGWVHATILTQMFSIVIEKKDAEIVHYDSQGCCLSCQHMILAIFKVHYHQHRDLPPTSQFGETIKIIATGLVKVSWLWSFRYSL